MPQRNIFKQHNHTTIFIIFLSFLNCFFFIAWQFSSRWWGSLTMVPAGNKAKHLSSVNHTTKKFHHHHHHHHHHQIHFPFSRVFFEEICVWPFGFLSGAELFSLDISGKTTAWITSICSTIWEEFDGTSSLADKLYA